ncbi:MAG: type I polyketide synthase [Candidatus Dadabacteria bacterium]|nr:type I polyketide synthase [Candidatus Dadabacteria bacterium]
MSSKVGRTEKKKDDSLATSKGYTNNRGRNEPIAIIGLGCRFAGANNPKEFWELLTNGIDAISEVPPSRFPVEQYYYPKSGVMGKICTKWGGFINDIDKFDPYFFGISPREANSMDPQQRLLLEVAWEALEDAGQTMERLEGSSTGVFVGMCTSDYCDLQTKYGDICTIDVYSATGSARSVLSGRLSYVLKLEGPSLMMDTACSSSLVAAHLACQSIWSGESDMALVGGVNLIISPDPTIYFSVAGMMALDGRCKAFDSRADGFVRSDGIGVVVLKSLSKALEDADPVYAVIRGSAVNNDGYGTGLMTPRREGQENVLRDAYRNAGISPGSVHYVEAHGTGTSVGDPVEALALGSVLSEEKTKDAPCIIGSVKTNIGHAEGAAGVAGLIKTALCLKHRTIPPSLNFIEPNPNIPWDDLPIEVQTELGPWPVESETAIAGVSSFGISGTNVHMVLEEPPRLPEESSKKQKQKDRPVVLALSANNTDTLEDVARSYEGYLSEEGEGVKNSLYDIGYTSCVRRTHHENRLAVIGRSHEEIAEKLSSFLKGERLQGLSQGAAQTGRQPKLVFICSPTGSQWHGMGLELFSVEPVFRETIEECDKVFGRWLDWSLIKELHADEKSSRIDEMLVVQPVLFALQVALAELWRSWGVVPDAVVGHSLGEVAAANIAGILDLKDAAQVICNRSILVDERVSGKGGMAIVELPVGEIREIIADYEDYLSVAASNSPTTTVVSGYSEALHEFCDTLEKKGIFCRLVNIAYASHSPQMDPILGEFKKSLKGIKPRDWNIPMVSTMTASVLKGTEYDKAYWTRSLRDPVYYSQSIELLADQGHEVFIELSPHPVLSVSTSQCLMSKKAKGAVLPSLRRNQGELDMMLSSLGELYTNGHSTDWSKLYPSKGRCVGLPPYPWQNDRFWIEGLDEAVSEGKTQSQLGSGFAKSSHPMLGYRVSTAVNSKEMVWQTSLSTTVFPYLADHRIQNVPIVPATVYIELALAAAKEAFGAARPELENVSFQKPIFLPENVTQTVQIILTPQTPAVASFQIYSLQRGDSEDRDSWTLLAKGRIHTGREDTKAKPPKRYSLRKIKAGSTLKSSGEQHYQVIGDIGFTFGPNFQGIHKLWLQSEEALGRLNIPDSVKSFSQTYNVHPAVLDYGFQVSVAATYLTHRTDINPGIYLPVGIESFRMYGNPEKTAWGLAVFRAEEEENPGILKHDVYLLDIRGKVVIEVKGLTTQRIDQAGGPSASQNSNEHLYRINFIPMESPELASESDNGQEPPPNGKWLVFADGGRVGKSLPAMFRARGCECVVVKPGDKFKLTYKRNGAEHYLINTEDPEDFRKLLDSAFDPGGSPCLGVVHLWSMDVPCPTGSVDFEDSQNLTCGSVLYLIHALAESGWPAYPRIRLVTAGVHRLGAESKPPSVAQSPIWGLGRVIAGEHPEFRCTEIDLSPSPKPSEIKALFQMLFVDDRENQIALRGKSLFVARLQSNSAGEQEQMLVSTSRLPFRLETTKPGILDNLVLREMERPKPGHGEVEIEVHAAALNFIDLMIAMGIYPGQPEGSLPLGTECAGTISTIGEGVDEFKVGDEVIALAPSSFASHTVAPAMFVVPKPKAMSFEEAATVPNVFLTAYYALCHLGKMSSGDRVLIHSASGGVGLAALQLAERAGAEIYATAGRPEKREYLKSLGIEHVMNSRTLDFADEIMAITGGEGVDIVLNSLSGDAIGKGLSILAPYGRFLEIGKRDIYEDSLIGLLPFKNSLSFYAIDLARMFTERSTLIGSLLRELMESFEDGSLKPLPHKVFKISESEDAFRFMAQAKHIGKIVLSLEENEVLVALSPELRVGMKENGTYLITGGLGGLGLTMAKWMVDKGAKHLVLLGRGGASEEASVKLDELRSRGVNVAVIKADVANEKQLRSVFKKIAKTMPPLRGIVHAAGVLDDGILLQMNMERFNTVMAPKVSGSWNLHTLSLELQLDFFVMFSSAASIMGSPGQGNYSSANAFMDSLAHYRRALGLPALTINWGAWTEVGMAASPERMKNLTSQGITPFTPEQGSELMEAIMKMNCTQVMPLFIDWANLLKFYPSDNIPPVLSEIAEGVKSSSSRGDGKRESKAREKILSAEPEDRQEMVESHLKELVAGVLGIPVSRLQMHKSLLNMGLDSLMGLELKNRIEAGLAVDLPVTVMLQGPSVSELAAELLKLLTDDGSQEGMEEMAETLGEVEGLSEEEVEAIVEEKR